MTRLHLERHSSHRVGWLRAAVLGANDGLVSTASLVLGVAASNAEKPAILLAGLAGLAAGAMSMAAGEYVSVSSQSDTESADLAREKMELAEQPDKELEELTNLLKARGVSHTTAQAAAKEMTAADALGAHAKEELGISDMTAARPIQAAITSAFTFAVGAVLPLLAVLVVPAAQLIAVVAASTVVFLAILGAAGAIAGGADVLKATLRVTFWGAIAMAVTMGVGYFFGTTVA